MTTPLRDPMEAGVGRTVAPTISFRNYGKKKPLKGIIVPVEVDDETRPYRVTQQTNQKGELLFFNKRGTSEPDPDAPRTQMDVTLLTELTNWEGTSDNFQEKQEEADDEGRLPDFGQRRIILKGGDTTKALKDALRKVGLTKPEVGGVLTQTLVKQVQKDGSEFKTNVFEFTYEKATPETIKKAMDAFDKIQALQGKTDSDGDSGGSDGDEPPF